MPRRIILRATGRLSFPALSRFADRSCRRSVHYSRFATLRSVVQPAPSHLLRIVLDHYFLVYLSVLRSAVVHDSNTTITASKSWIASERGLRFTAARHSPIPLPERSLVVLPLRPGNSAFRADALKSVLLTETQSPRLSRLADKNP
jgi:hypothetical protein